MSNVNISLFCVCRNLHYFTPTNASTSHVQIHDLFQLTETFDRPSIIWMGTYHRQRKRTVLVIAASSIRTIPETSMICIPETWPCLAIIVLMKPRSVSLNLSSSRRILKHAPSLSSIHESSLRINESSSLPILKSCSGFMYPRSVRIMIDCCTLAPYCGIVGTRTNTGSCILAP